eukprot:TRINITY_DN26202_c0_g1_i1.p1 TRINITY_DN26202_c0_g1~~TRINITY_DN26202_c0_g1_i1.p1  ORF type:complete len:119 (-),score=30.22 TRINITY_DN26202_c0_g1_i1:46-402(-)
MCIRARSTGESPDGDAELAFTKRELLSVKKALSVITRKNSALEEKMRRLSSSEVRNPMETLASGATELIATLERQNQELSLIHISEPTRLLSISYAVLCLKQQNIKKHQNKTILQIKV